MKKELKSRAYQFPFPVVIVLIYLLLGYVWNLWHPAWIIFLTIPLYYYTLNLIDNLKKNPNKSFLSYLPYPIICVIIYFVLGVFFKLWHPAWLIFLTIPIGTFFVSGNKNINDHDEQINNDLDNNSL